VGAKPARRNVVQYMQSRGLSERQSRAMINISDSVFRHQPVPYNNQALSAQIIELTHLHRR